MKTRIGLALGVSTGTFIPELINNNYSLSDVDWLKVFIFGVVTFVISLFVPDRYLGIKKKKDI